jgi:hypothetical protein
MQNRMHHVPPIIAALPLEYLNFSENTLAELDGEVFP